MFQVKGDQIIGARTRQEDSFRIEQLDTTAQHLMVITDGMGGHAGGAQASRIVADSFVDAWLGGEGTTVDRLHDALFYANDQVARAIEDDPELVDMGTTLLACVLDGSELSWVSVGDSILWVYRDGKLLRINDDHSMAPVIDGLVEIGRMTPEEAASDPRRNQLRSVVTGEDIPLIDISKTPLVLEDADILLLATDGILTLGEDEIISVLRDSRPAGPEACAGAIFAAIESHAEPQQDNTTLIVASQD